MTIEKGLGILFILDYWIIYCILSSLIMQLLTLRIYKNTNKLNCNSCQAVKNEMLHDLYTS